ncbi:unnamed protein product [Caenorhabditis angaria]|uniref:Uncharacterized protein n=1 Tax=Caenorhabditis angaria TaxID=860376 RepID=A0A9P1IM56_9PELO|nr:unnamed protein product [Caenorhabditis angaria]
MNSLVGVTVEEREIQICRLGWSLLVLWLVTVIYMTREIWFGQTSIAFEEAKMMNLRQEARNRYYGRSDEESRF